MATVVFATGWEHGITPITTGLGLCNDIAVANSTPAISSGTKRTGSYALEVKCVAGVGEATIGYTLGSGATAVASLYFRVATLPSTSFALVCNFFDSAFATTTAIRVASTGVVTAIVGAGTAQTGPTISTNTWYRLDLKFDTSGTTWTLDWQVNGTAYTQATEAAHSINSSTKYFYLRSGSGSMTGTCDLFFDDLVCSLTSGDYPIGQRLIYNAPLESAASHQGIVTSEWQTTTDGFAANAVNFTGTGETTSQSLLADASVTTAIRMNPGAAAITGYGRWPIQANASDPATTPECVVAIVGVREEAAGTNNAILRTEYVGATTNIFSADPSWSTTVNYLKSVMAVRPGGGAWTNADIDSINFEADSTDADPDIWINHVTYEVVYPVPSATVNIAVPTATISHASSLTGATITGFPAAMQVSLLAKPPLITLGVGQVDVLVVVPTAEVLVVGAPEPVLTASQTYPYASVRIGSTT